MTKRKVSTAARKAQWAKTDDLADRGEPADRTARGEGHGQAAQDQDTPLRERARQIISELGNAEASVLQQWMAHYVAELIQRADDRTQSTAERAVARQECVGVIARLWRVEQARERTELGFAVYQRERFGAGRSELERGPDLATALVDSAVVSGWSAADRVLAVFLLAETEQEIVRFLINVSLPTSETKSVEPLPQTDDRDPPSLQDDAAAGSEDDEEDDSDDNREAFEREARRAQSVLAAVFPEVGDLELSDYAGASRFATQALLRVLRLKATLLEFPLEHLDLALSLPKPRPKAAKRAAKPRTTRQRAVAKQQTRKTGGGLKSRSGGSSDTKKATSSQRRKRRP